MNNIQHYDSINVNAANYGKINRSGVNFYGNTKPISKVVTNAIEKESKVAEETINAELNKLEQVGRSLVTQKQKTPRDLISLVDFNEYNLARKNDGPYNRCNWTYYNRRNYEDDQKTVKYVHEALRYGTRPDKKIKLKTGIINKVIEELEKMGIKNATKEDIKIIRAKDSGRKIYTLPMFYDKTTQESIIFMNDGRPNYKVQFEYDTKGNIKSAFRSYVFFD